VVRKKLCFFFCITNIVTFAPKLKTVFILKEKSMAKFRKGMVGTLCVLLLSVFMACEKKSETSKEFQHIKTELGGCNNAQYEPLRGDSEMESDTVIITISENLVNVFVGYGFVCKADPFETEVEIIDDVICMKIIDTCDGTSSESCYYKCECYYTFDFVFNAEAISRKYKILLFTSSPPNGEESPILIAEGTIGTDR